MVSPLPHRDLSIGTRSTSLLGHARSWFDLVPAKTFPHGVLYLTYLVGSRFTYQGRNYQNPTKDQATNIASLRAGGMNGAPTLGSDGTECYTSY